MWLNKDLSVIKFLNLPVSHLFQINRINEIPIPEPFICSYFPYCNFHTHDFSELNNHLQIFHKINQDKELLIHEQIIQNLLIKDLHHIKKDENYKRLCPLPNCYHILTDNFELINHINNDHTSEIIFNSLKTVGLFWTLIYSWTKVYDQLPTALNLLKFK